MKTRRKVLAASALAIAAALASAQAAPALAAAAASPYARVQNTIEGYWDVDDAARRAAVQGLRAELTPAGLEMQRRNQADAAARTARGEITGLNNYICGVNSPPNIYTTSEPWALVVSKDMVIQTGERTNMIPRYFHTDGRQWPADLASLPPSNNGHSIGRWEGKDLVVDTRGLPEGGVSGGGFKGPNSLMTERFSVSPDGKRLTITITITDPTLMTKPHTYQVFYDRAPEHTFAFGAFCDPNHDPAGLQLGHAPAQD